MTKNDTRKEDFKEKSKNMARIAIQALGDKKAEDIKVIDISGVSVLADYFIIASGSNRSQIQALTDHVEEQFGRSDLIVHIFDRENRLFYDLERIWRDGKAVEVSEFGLE